MPNIRTLNTVRIRSYLFRLPLFTRFALILIVLLWALGLQTIWDLRKWGSLIPSEVSLLAGMCRTQRDVRLACFGSSGMTNIFMLYLAHRLTTYPLIHLNVFHAALNVIALAPLLERFEYEYGTLNTVALFFGRK